MVVASKKRAGKPKTRRETCTAGFLAFLVFLLNIIFWVAGAAVLGIGIWSLVHEDYYLVLLTTSTYSAASYILIIAGALIFIIGFLGCCGALMEHTLMLKCYLAFVMLVFLLEVIAGLIALIYKDTISDELYTDFSKVLKRSYAYDGKATEAIDTMQQQFMCCGSSTYEDWYESRWSTDGLAGNNSVPDSCCKTMWPEGCGERVHFSNIYRRGCLFLFEEALNEHLIVVGTVAFAVATVQILVILFTCCLVKKIRDEESNI